MVFFEDTLENCVDFRTGAYRTHIQHYPCDTDYGVLIMSDPGCRDCLGDPAELAKSSPLKLSVKGDDHLTALLPYARVELSHDECSGALRTSLDFIRDYQDILIGRNQGWQLHAADVYDDTVFLHYVNLSHDATGRISIKGYPKELWLDVPEPPQETEDESRGFFNSFRKPDPTPSYTPTKTTPVAILNYEDHTMIIWTGDNLHREQPYIDELSIGQRMLKIIPDDDEPGTYKIERVYHQSDLRQERLSEVLHQFTPGYFAL